MDIAKYSTNRLNKYHYQFFSEGSKGKFDLRIRFSVLDLEMYNLSFGVWNTDSQEMDDLIETRNGDMEMILATVAVTVEEFLSKNKRATVLASGSSRARTRKYQMSIARNLRNVSDKYVIMGLIIDKDKKGGPLEDYSIWEGTWSKFKLGVNYDAFLIYSK